jgi:hypothetical protein
MTRALPVSLLALWMATAPAAAQDGNFGMPPDAAQKSRKYCAKYAGDSFSSQASCMDREKAGFDRLSPTYQNERIKFDLGDEGRKAAARAADHYRDPVAIDVCSRPYRMSERDGCKR